ncbi:hypothetical protein JCM19239_2683 [Vibrio variabilis]|uniref:Uncharacterized protein n=1 Tax=Vibrio variabilis TaxID=990271 RepID=A0ABQ0JNJ3_9VIBR|nr:hypothetical protein JCM19239_2683 [Vibrio variabilis]
MLKITFKIDGKPVKPNDIGDVIRATFFVAIENHVRETLGVLTCPIHHEAPQITIHGDDLDNMSFEFNGCCDELISMVEELFNQQEVS